MQIFSWLRGLCLWVFWLVWTALSWALIVLTWPFAPHGDNACLFARLWARGVLLASGIRVNVEGREHLRGGPFVVLANHSSMLDIPAGYAALPIQLRFVSRPFFFKVPFMGWSMSMARHVSMDPKRPREAAEVLRSLDSRFRRGASIMMFPEGTRSLDGQVQRYKRGPILLAIRSGVALLPVCIDGAFEALPKGRFLPKPGRVRGVIGEPVPTEGVAERDARRLASEIEAWTRSTKSNGDQQVGGR